MIPTELKVSAILTGLQAGLLATTYLADSFIVQAAAAQTSALTGVMSLAITAGAYRKDRVQA